MFERYMSRMWTKMKARRGSWGCIGRISLIFTLCLSEAGCSTKEWRREISACETKYDREIPPEYAQVTVQRTRIVQVPSGNVYCNTYGYGASSVVDCVQSTRTESIPYTAVETVDKNQDYRNKAVLLCAKSACIRKYDNEDCDSRR